MRTRCLNTSKVTHEEDAHETKHFESIGRKNFKAKAICSISSLVDCRTSQRSRFRDHVDFKLHQTHVRRWISRGKSFCVLIEARESGLIRLVVEGRSTVAIRYLICRMDPGFVPQAPYFRTFFSFMGKRPTYRYIWSGRCPSQFHWCIVIAYSKQRWRESWRHWRVTSGTLWPSRCWLSSPSEPTFLGSQITEFPTQCTVLLSARFFFNHHSGRRILIIKWPQIQSL